MKNFKGLGLLLKSLIAYNCYNLVYEIKDYFLSLGISKETVEKYGRQYFHEGYLENCQWHYNQELKMLIKRKGIKNFNIQYGHIDEDNTKDIKIDIGGWKCFVISIIIGFIFN